MPVSCTGSANGPSGWQKLSVSHSGGFSAVTPVVTLICVSRSACQLMNDIVSCETMRLLNKPSSCVLATTYSAPLYRRFAASDSSMTKPGQSSA
jgi:hypothetical protein